jgi:hypothetical protein
MMQPEMILETVETMQRAIEQGKMVNVLVNNMAGGNAPLIAGIIAEEFLTNPEPKGRHKLTLWNL